MRLQDYLTLAGLSVPEFSTTIGVTPQTTWRWLNGTRVPSRVEMRNIYRATKGAVSPNDFLLEDAP